MSKLKIAIIISTTRAARFGHKPAQWIRDIAAARDDMETEIVDLRDFPMPFFDEVASDACAPSQDQGADFMAVWKDGKELKDITYLQAGVKDMLDQLAWWTKALKAAREQEVLTAAAAA